MKSTDWLAERDGFEPSRPFISHMLPRSHTHFLLRGRILSIIFIGVWERCQRHPCSGTAQAIGRFENRPSRPNRGVIAIGRASRSADGLSRFGLTSSLGPAFLHHFRKSLSAGRRKTPATSCCGALAVPSGLALDTATPQTRLLWEPIRTLIEMETVGRLRHAR